MRLAKLIEKAFFIVFIILLGTLLAICFTGTFHHISLFNITVATLGMFGGVGAFLFLLKKAEELLEKVDHRRLWIFLGIWGVLLFLFGCIFHNLPAADYSLIYPEVENFVNGEEISWWYFARWKNNLPLFYILCATAKLGSILGVRDIFYSLFFLNTIGAVMCGYCIYWLLDYFYPKRAVVRWMGLLLFIGFIPLWGGQYFVYTDSVSMICGIGAVTAYLSGRKAFRYVISGILTAVGYLVKPTSIFCVIALLLVALVYRREVFKWKTALLFGLAAAAVVTGYQVSAAQLPHQELHDQYTVPFAYWPAMGLLGNGSYWQNQDFAALCVDAPDYGTRKEVAINVIKENYTNLWDWNHIKDKMRLNFANGNFGLSDYNRIEGVGLYEYLNEYGKYGGYMSIVTTSYYYMMLILIWLSAVKLLWTGDGMQHRLLIMVMVTLFGLICFLMLWEANNRQLYNHMPWFAIGAAASAGYLFKGIDRKGML